MSHGSHLDWKTCKMEEHFPVWKNPGVSNKILENFELFMLGNWKKYWKNQGNLSARKSKNHGNMVPHYKRDRASKLLEKCKKYWKSQENLSARKGERMCTKKSTNEMGLKSKTSRFFNNEKRMWYIFIALINETPNSFGTNLFVCNFKVIHLE